MAVRRDIFYITTDAGADADRRQAQLAQRTQRVPDGEADLFGIETFVHSYDPEQAQAWLQRARDPLIGGRPASSLPLNEEALHARSPKAKQQMLAELGITEGMAQPEALARIKSIRPGRDAAPLQVLPAQMADLMTLRARVEVLPATARVSQARLAVMEPWERVAAQIDLLSRDQQEQVVRDQLVSIQKFIRAMNVCYPAILALRRVAERAWGYYAHDSDEYMRGLSSRIINAKLQATQPPPFVNGWWRQYLADWQSTFYGTSQGDWNGGLTLFGWVMRGNEDSRPIGCRRTDPNANIITPNNCPAPTGEAHRVWFQSDATLFNGDIPPPTWAWLAERMGGRSAISGGDSLIGGFNYLVPGGAMQMGWTAPIFIANHMMLEAHRLWATPPLEWYWRMYFAPQPEFGGRSFVEWAQAMEPQEFVRRMRRENTQRNQRTAGVFNTLIEALAGQAAVNAAREQLQAERSGLRNVQTVSTVGGGLATGLTATGVGAIPGLIVGAVTAATVGLLSALQNSVPEVRIDVYGVMCPVFSQFAIYGDKARFAAVSAQQVGMPPAAQGNNNSNLAIIGTSYIMPTARGDVRIEGMPHYGAVFIDGARIDDRDARWESDALTVWVVPVPHGTHRITVQPPTGTGRTALVQAGAAPVTLQFSTMPLETQLVEVAETPPTSKSPAPATLSTGVKVGLTVAVVGAVVGAVVWSSRAKKRNRPKRRRH